MILLDGHKSADDIYNSHLRKSDARPFVKGVIPSHTSLIATTIVALTAIRIPTWHGFVDGNDDEEESYQIPSWYIVPSTKPPYDSRPVGLRLHSCETLKSVLLQPSIPKEVDYDASLRPSIAGMVVAQGCLERLKGSFGR